MSQRKRPATENPPLFVERKDPRPIGLAKEKFVVSDEFFQPLPDELVALFNGEPV